MLHFDHGVDIFNIIQKVQDAGVKIIIRFDIFPPITGGCPEGLGAL